MKTLISCTLALLSIGSISFAQSYSIDWYKIAGGGGTSTGGPVTGTNYYSVSGTLGQPDASGAMTGGNYSLTGGFWSLINVVQTTGAPTLSITHSGNSVIVSWPTPSASWTLQQNGNLAGGSWATSGYLVSTNGGINSITITSPAGNLFFRLSNP
jgi:hypothetical protein